jgi:hypothetical protein
VELTNDSTYFDGLLERPEIRERVVDDARGFSLFAFAPAFEQGAFGVRVHADEVPAGGFVFCPDGEDLEVHTLLLPNCRGGGALEAGRKTLALVKEKFVFNRVKSFCPGTIPEAYWFARRLGFHLDRIDPEGWEKNGQKHSMKYVSLQREAI